MTAKPRRFPWIVGRFFEGHRGSIYPVIFLVPLDKGGASPDLDSGLRVKAEIAARGGDVGQSLSGTVAGPAAASSCFFARCGRAARLDDGK